jgi:hypothetical protein
MTRITVIKPFTWTNALDERGVVHRVVSLPGVMHLCAARCGLDGRWSHAPDVKARPTEVLMWTDEAPSCMTCIVKEAKHEPS